VIEKMNKKRKEREGGEREDNDEEGHESGADLQIEGLEEA